MSDVAPQAHYDMVPRHFQEPPLMRGALWPIVGGSLRRRDGAGCSARRFGMLGSGHTSSAKSAIATIVAFTLRPMYYTNYQQPSIRG